MRNKKNLFWADFILEDIAYSSCRIAAIQETWSFGGMASDIILVPYLQRRLLWQQSKMIEWVSYPLCLSRISTSLLIFHKVIWLFSQPQNNLLESNDILLTTFDFNGKKICV
jgi:hypothetical protein